MAAGATFEPIATTTLGSAAASVTFSSIPGTYTDLVLVISARSTSGTSSIDAQFNGDTGSNYSLTYVYGTGSAAASGRDSNTAVANAGTAIDTASTFMPNILQIQSYSNTNVNKTVLTRANNTSGNVLASVSMWRNTSAITSILLKLATGTTFTSGSTFNLYGILSA